MEHHTEIGQIPTDRTLSQCVGVWETLQLGIRFCTVFPSVPKVGEALSGRCGVRLCGAPIPSSNRFSCALLHLDDNR